MGSVQDVGDSFLAFLADLIRDMDDDALSSLLYDFIDVDDLRRIKEILNDLED